MVVLVMGCDKHWSYDTLELAVILPGHVDYLTLRAGARVCYTILR